jgi:hypothetical protein
MKTGFSYGGCPFSQVLFNIFMALGSKLLKAGDEIS